MIKEHDLHLAMVNIPLDSASKKISMPSKAWKGKIYLIVLA